MALTLLAGAGLGAAVIQGLHAQAKPPIYAVIAIQKITDAEAYKPLPVKGQAAAEAAARSVPHPHRQHNWPRWNSACAACPNQVRQRR